MKEKDFVKVYSLSSYKAQTTILFIGNGLIFSAFGSNYRFGFY